MVINKICKYCSKEFTKSPHYSFEQWRKRLFCSNKCRSLSKRIRLKKECIICKTKFEVIPSTFEKLKCCSKKCRYLNIGSLLKGNKHSLGYKHTKEAKEKIRLAIKKNVKRGEKSNFWKGGISKKNRTKRANFMRTFEYIDWRRKVFERDGYLCIIGGKEHGNKLQADHIKSFLKYPKLRLDINNGRTLCVECHKKTDNYGLKKIRKSYFKQ